MMNLKHTTLLLFFVLGIAHAVARAEDASHVQSTLSVSGTGIVIPARSWDISAEVNNKISKLHFIEGQFVQKGDLLVEFDRAFKAFDVTLAEIGLARARANLAKAKENLARKRKLSESAVSRAALRDAELDADILAADADKAAIQLEKAELILSVQKLSAPFDGQMTAPRYRENANVDVAEGHEVATLIQLDPIHVRIQGTYERLFARLSAGQKEIEVLDRLTLKLELPDGTSYPHTGRLLTSAFEFDSETGLGTTIGEFPNPEYILRPGLRVKITSYERRN